MQVKLLSARWPQIAGLFLMGGALAWTVKLGVIISTNGRIISTGAAAFLMTAGLLLLFVGSTGIGYRLSLHWHWSLRVLAILLSPVVVFGSFLLFAMVLTPLVQNSSVWYAKQEAAIALAAVVYFVVGAFLYRSRKSMKSIIPKNTILPQQSTSFVGNNG